MTINDKQDEIIAEFEFLEDWLDKYQQIIDKGMESKGVDAQYKTPEYLIEGCQSKVWLIAEMQDDKVMYQAESNTDIAGGIATMLVEVLSGHTPQEIVDTDLYFVEQIGLKEHLSPTRANGMLAMMKQMKLYALAFQAQQV